MGRQRFATAVWRAALVVCAVALYVTALSNGAYQVTSPPSVPYHIVLRKTYALGAFALIGFLLEQSDIPWLHGIWRSAIAVGLYSTAIEFGQTYISGSREPMGEHVFDIASGVVGGAFGSWFSIALNRRSATH